MSKNVSTETIANYLNISRATVSRALNGQHVGEKTRKAVIDAAVKLGYKSYGIASNKASVGRRKVLILCAHPIITSSFFYSVTRGIESILTATNTELIQYADKHPFTQKDKRDLEAFIRNLKIDGIICFGYYNKQAIEDILSLHIPALFFDFDYLSLDTSTPCDIILSESINSMENFCSRLIREQNCRTFGYVGDWRHCRGFYERFLGLREALFLNGIPYEETYNITKSNKNFGYDPRSLYKTLHTFRKMPDCFVCANDYIAHALLSALTKMNVDIPRSVRVVGFDNVLESRRTGPPLSTFDIDKQLLGKRALLTLLERIDTPNMDTRLVYMISKYIPRDSTID